MLSLGRRLNVRSTMLRNGTSSRRDPSGAPACVGIFCLVGSAGPKVSSYRAGVLHSAQGAGEEFSDGVFGGVDVC